MIQSISNKILNFFITKGAITEEYEIYRYGIEVIVSNSIGMIVILLTSLYFNIVDQGIIFIIVFAELRSKTGGFHCDTYLWCNITYISTYLIYLGVMQYLNYSLCLTLMGVCFLITLYLAPVDHYNKELNNEEKKKFRKQSIVCFVLFTIISILIKRYTYIITYALVSSSILLIVGKVVREHVKKSS